MVERFVSNEEAMGSIPMSSKQTPNLSPTQPSTPPLPAALCVCCVLGATFPLLHVQGSLGLVLAFLTAGSFFFPPPMALKLLPST